MQNTFTCKVDFILVMGLATSAKICNRSDGGMTEQ